MKTATRRPQKSAELGPRTARPHVHRAPAPRREIDGGVLARAAAIFRAAGEPERLRILDRLCDGELCVSELAEDAGVDMPTVSQRLRVLRSEGLVSRRREGSHIYYALSDSHIADLVRSTLDHAREGWEPGSRERKDR